MLTHSFKCQTCLLRKDAPEGMAPIFPGNECDDEYFANNHILICLVCQLKIFQGICSKHKASGHISECVVKLLSVYLSHMSVLLACKPCG